MAKTQIIRERRFKIELYELDEKLELKNGKKLEDNKAICELETFSVNFALNDIPTATATPLLGKEIQANGSQIKFQTLYNLAIDSKPVGVYFTVIHSFRSDNNPKDNQYWPEGACCVFKGYLCPPTWDISAYNAKVEFSIWHWLSAMANISLLTSASHTSNPSEVAIAGYGHLSGNTESLWQPFILTEGVKLSKVWDEGIKEIYKQVLDWGDQHDRSDKINNLVKVQRERIRTILEKIESDKTELSKNIDGPSLTLRNLVALDLCLDSPETFINICGWNKLIQHYAPAYLFAISPGVDKTRIIPAPCTIDPKEAIEIIGDEIFKIKATPYMAKRVSRVVCTAAIQESYASTPMGKPYYRNLGVYPPKGKFKEGLVVVAAFPPWLTRRGISVLPVAESLISFFEDPNEVLPTVDHAAGAAGNIQDAQNTIGDVFAKYCYLVQAFNGTNMQVVTPGRMDICPGAMVKIQANFMTGGVLLYGTVASVTVSLSSGTTPPTSVFMLTNIRPQESVDDPVDNPQDGAGWYDKQWSGKGVTLYAK